MQLNINKLYKKLNKIYKYNNSTKFNNKILDFISKKYNNKLNYNIVNIDINFINYYYILDLFYLDNNNKDSIKSFYINIKDLNNIINKINLKQLYNLDIIDQNNLDRYNKNNNTNIFIFR